MYIEDRLFCCTTIIETCVSEEPVVDGLMYKANWLQSILIWFW